MDIIIEHGGEQGISNYSALIAAVNEQLSTYKGLVVLEENIPSAKATVAELRRTAKAASDYRIAIKKEHEARIAQTIDQLKEITRLYEEAGNAIDSQVKEFEEKAKQRKQEEITAYFDSVIGQLGDFLLIGTIWNPKWLNKGYSMDDIKAEIDNAISHATAGMRSIMEMNSPHEQTLLRLFFSTLSMEKVYAEKDKLDVQLAQMEKLKAEKEEQARIANLKAQESVSPVQSTDAPQKWENPVEADFKRYTLSFTITATKPQLIALKSFLLNSGIEYHKC